MLPVYQRLDAPKSLYSVPFRNVAIAVVSLPLGGFIFCVIWSLLFEFDRATFTHCDVPNYLPSVSAAVGNYEPQRTVWRFAICLHLPGRIVVARMYFQYYRDTIRRNRRLLATFACLLHVIENLALLTLTLWTSADNYQVHRNAFIVFIVCSELYMLISYFLNKNGRKIALQPIEEKSLRYKRNLFLLNLASFFLAIYCFMRHNSHCEPGVYTFFALFEYIVVLTNMSYHMTAHFDFYSVRVTFDWVQGLSLTEY